MSSAEFRAEVAVIVTLSWMRSGARSSLREGEMELEMSWCCYPRAEMGLLLGVLDRGRMNDVLTFEDPADFFKCRFYVPLQKTNLREAMNV